MTLSEVLPKPVETGNDELAEKFKTYLKNGPNLTLTLLPFTETIGESAGVLRGKYPHLKTVDAVQIAAALDANFNSGSNINDFVKLTQGGNNITVSVDTDGADDGSANWVDVGTLDNYGTSGDDLMNLLIDNTDYELKI